eukprot:scaffold24898_cov173-Amphora_coffeaeformis.AAC.2
MTRFISSRFLVGVFGLLCGRGCAFQNTGHGPLKTNGSYYPTDLASTNGYLENLSNQKSLPVLSGSVASPPPSPATALTAIVATAESTSGSAMGEFQYVPVLSLSQANAIADKAIECCVRNGFSPVTVYVLDSGGSPLVSKRMDGCSPVGIPDFAKAKAYSCIVNKYPSRAFRDRYTSEEASAKFCQMTSMVAISGNQMAPFPGGILLKVSETIIGAVGVSGASGDEDEYCAIRGVIESGLSISTVPENHCCTTVKDEMVLSVVSSCDFFVGYGNRAKRHEAVAVVIAFIQIPLEIEIIPQNYGILLRLAGDTSHSSSEQN